MRLIKHVDVRNFRTCRAVSLDDFNAYVPFVGLNGSGKSNLLRALSVFFEGEVEPGLPLNLKRDHFDPGRPLGGRRRVSIRVTFDLSEGYEPRQEVARAFERLGVSDALVVERAWTYADPSATAMTEELLAASDTDLQPLADEDARALATFVRSIKFRYVPNHIRPSDLLGTEIQTLRRAINRRVRARTAFRTGGVQDALDDLGEVTTEILADLSKQVSAHSPEITGIAPDIPKDFAELAFQLGISTVTESGLRQAPDLQGSGTQSYMLYHVLDLVDRSAFEVDFGWTKAVVWAIEEPESFLHAGLRTRLAEDLASFSNAERRQVFLTTHEPEFQRVADEVWVVTRQGAATSFERIPAREAVVHSSRLRISSYEHPLFLSPDRPLVIVEGNSDVAYLRAAVEASGLKPMWTMVSLSDLERERSGGSDVEAYLRANAAVLRSRPLHAPVIVLRDWEDNERTLQKFSKALEPHETSCVVKPSAALCNPDLSQKFRGIERFVTTEAVESVLSDVVRPKSMSVRLPLQIDKKDLDDRKHELLEAVVDSGDPGPFMVDLIEWLDGEVRAAVGEAPTGQMILPY